MSFPLESESGVATHRPARIRLLMGRGFALAVVAYGLSIASGNIRAGDILRGGAPAGSPGRVANPNAPSAQAAAQARANARDALARTSRAVESVQRAQHHAARSAVRNAGADPNHSGQMLPDVPDGLAIGGLRPAANAGTDLSVWSGAFLPEQTQAGGKKHVTVRQTSPQALLNWETFNIGSATHLRFDQSAGKENTGQWIAFNKVNDPSGRPSQILGSMSADGQVYVINQNGIIFGSGSQVNAHTLVASSLPINDSLISRGLLNQARTAQFLFSALPQSGETPFTPPPLPASGRIGDVTVQAGARLTSPTTAANVGGRIALIGPNVTNHGTISTPDGQTILAAGLQVGFEGHISSDASLRGLDTYVGEVGDYEGRASNHGLIEAPRGNITLTGREVWHTGTLESRTSVSLNGRIDLRAEYNAVANQVYDPTANTSPAFLYGGIGGQPSTGRVTLGPGSVIRILPEWGNPDTVPGTKLALQSQVNVRGGSIELERGAMIHAPSGSVTLSTGTWDHTPSGTAPVSNFVRSGGQIYLGPETMINVAGTTDAAAALSDYILTVTLRAAELADAPLLRDSFFRGGDITVDLRKSGIWNGRAWVGTPLADLTGYLNLIPRTIDQLTVAGGTVTLNSGGSVIADPSSKIDVSGGWENYSSGTVKTTRLLRHGHLIDIASAAPDRLYDGIFTGEFEEVHARWGITRTYRVPWMTGEYFDAGYLSGADAGRLTLGGSSMAMDGQLLGRAVSGPRQRENPAMGGTIDFNLEIQRLVPGSGVDPLISPTPPSITFTHQRQRPATAFGLDADGAPLPLREDRVAQLHLNPDLLAEAGGGFAALNVRNPDGNITVPRGVTLKAPVQGSIRLEGANIRISGDVLAPSGNLAFLAYNISPSVAEALLLAGGTRPAADLERGHFVLAPGSTVSAAGSVIDQRRTNSPTFLAPLLIDGGSVSIQAWSADLATGSTIDVSGGARALPGGSISYGKAGSIEILTGQDLTLDAVDGGRLRLGSRLKGFSGMSVGGTLSLQAQLIQIGGAPLHPASLVLRPDFFSQGGFSTFNLTGLGALAPEGTESDFLPAVSIANGTRMNPHALGWLAIPYGGPGGSLTLMPFLRPEGFRAPVNLSLTGKGVRDELAGSVLVYRGDVRVGAGADVRTDALGSITLAGDTVAVYGKLAAPSGRIAITGGSTYLTLGSPANFAQSTVYLAPGARLDTSGAVLSSRDRFGRTVGSVLPGGSVSLSGNIIAEAGAVIDVSGTSGLLDLHPAERGLDYFGNPLALGSRLVQVISGVNSALYQSLRVPTRIDSAGGSITMTGQGMLFSDATLLGWAGGPTALGGSLAISSRRFIPAGTDSNTAETNLVVTQSGLTIPVPLAAAELSGIGQVVRDASGTMLPGMGYFAADAFARGGFSSLSLGGNVEFRGPVRIHADKALRVASGGVIRADASVFLSAEYAALGQAFLPPQLAGASHFLFNATSAGGVTSEYTFAPVFGPGGLTVVADHIDIGTLSLQGIGATRLTARGGDIRGNGTLQAARLLELNAAQIYPTTGSPFNIVVYDGGGQPGSIVISRSGNRHIPLSASGTLNFFASRIEQGGVLRAPFGSIQLGWDGSGAAPLKNPIAGNTIALPVTQHLTLLSGGETSVAAVDPRTGQGVTIPYGMVQGAGSWIAPSGLDITALGPPEKRINFGAANAITEAGSLIDVRGGGDLFAYEWIPGIGGTQDILAPTGSYAIMPGYDSAFSPYAPFNMAADIFGGDVGYQNTTLGAGDQIYLGPNYGVPAGSYTLLPARYALLPGAFLVTPLSSAPVGSVALPDGSIIASGYRWNTLNPGTSSIAQKRWELLPGSVVRQRSLYGEYTGSRFFAEAAEALNFKTPRLPQDSGRLVFQATGSMALNSWVLAQPIGSGRGALVDISSPLDIFIGGVGASAPEGSLYLPTQQLNSIGAESLLVGGVREITTAGSQVTVNASRLTVDNAGLALTGSDIILAAKQALELRAGSVIESTNSGGTAETLIFGHDDLSGSGNGLLVRVATDANASSQRFGVTTDPTPMLATGDGVRLSGSSVTLDSTAGSTLSGNAFLDAGTVNLSSGQISVMLENAGTVPAGNSLVLDGGALASLEANARTLNLLSYSSIDLYGTGWMSVADQLRLSAGQIRGFNQQGGDFILAANTVMLDNRGASSALDVTSGNSGSLIVEASRIVFGAGEMKVDQFSTMRLLAPGGLVVSGTGSVRAGGAIEGAVSAITPERGANYAVIAEGAFSLAGLAGGTSAAPSLGGILTLQGSSVHLGTEVLFPSGAVTVRSTAGDVSVSGRVLAAGTMQRMADMTRYTSGGQVTFAATGGGVHLQEGSIIDVSAHAEGGDAGRMELSSPYGNLVVDGKVLGTGNASGLAGSISVDVQSLPVLSALGGIFDHGGFFAGRTIRVRSGDVLVDGVNRARSFDLSTDQGSITVAGTIDASGETGGSISLAANQNLTLSANAVLTAAAQAFNNAGKGGVIRLEAGAQTGGVIPAESVLDLQPGSRIDLGVAEHVAGASSQPGSSAFSGKFTGTLHLRALQNAAGNDLALNPIDSHITGASAIIAEGYKLYDLTGSGGAITSSVQDNIKTDGALFGDSIAGITNRLLAGGEAHPLAASLVVVPGAEIINTAGNLTLGTASSTRTADWDLSGFRFGPKNAPGVLTLRVAGDLVFYNTLSDGFSGGPNLWLSPLMAQNPLLPINAQSWSYRLAAGADLSAASWRDVMPPASPSAGTGSLILGKNYGNATFASGTNASTEAVLDNGNRLQVIRTGSGDIEITAAGDVRLMNVFSTIYTAGTQVANATSIYAANDFSLPVLEGMLNNINTVLGRQQQNYAAQYAMSGGNVSISAGQDIARYTLNTAGELIDDTSRQIPGNWLYRRGYVDPLTGKFGAIGASQSTASMTDASASTTWWVDYSNFFQGIGALGGGNVTLQAGRDVRNVDAVAPTNARAPGGVPDIARLVELGGGDVTVRTGADIHGGTYYVERGQGILNAGGSITLDSTRVGAVEAFNPRSPSLGIIASLSNPAVTDPEGWIPTMLFLGRGAYDIDARSDVLLGPVVNTFLAPSGIGNKYWYKTWFSTYGEDSGVDVTSLNGDIAHRLAVTLPDGFEPIPALQAWLQTQNVFNTQSSVDMMASNRQPWLRLSEANVGQSSSALSVMPAHLSSTALAGNIRVTGTMTLAPSPSGSLELLAAGGVHGLNPTGLSDYISAGVSTHVWSAASINLSDASPAALPSPMRPLAYHSVAEKNSNNGLQAAPAAARSSAFALTGLDAVFAESGSYQGAYAVSQVKQALHASSVLHAADPNPLRIYALGGDISGLTLYSAKAARLLSGQDISDVALYLQNVRESDVSLVSAARDILPYNPNSPLRTQASAIGNLISRNQTALPGDIQIGGPGSLQILAGRRLTLGAAPELRDGTGDGISSIGNLRNPFLPGQGADLLLAAGIGPALSLEESSLNFEEFISQYVRGGEGQKYLAELGFADFETLNPNQQSLAALEVFFRILRDSGRDYGSTGNYEAGNAAIEALFGQSPGVGDINLSSRAVKTRSGGAISIIAPGGGLSLGSSLGNSPVPPGIITESGGNISIYAKDSVDVGVLRIFTLRGGNIMIWSAEGDVAAGSSSKTVAAAPPTRVVIDPQSADVATDLAGLSTGGGIGVLATVKNVEPGDVDLIAPLGAVDAGDAGIRSSGNLTIAAAQVLNAGNIAVAGSSTGSAAPAAPPAPSAPAAPPPPAQTASAPPAAAEAAAQAQSATAASDTEALPSEVVVEVLGYGGGPAAEDDEEDEEEKEREQKSE